MKNFILVSVFLFISSISLHSQAVFKKGYIIKNGNDTVHGMIEFKGNKTNSTSCIFKQDNESESKLFSPLDILGYRFDESKFYISKFVTVNGKDERLFLEYLINGTVDLYYYYDGLIDYYYIDAGDGKLIELKKSSIEYDTYRRRVVQESKQHIGILKYIFRESPTISKQVENIDLNRKSLIDIAHAYHTEMCADQECIIYEKKKPRRENMVAGVFVGLSMLTINEKSDIPYDSWYLRGSDFGTIMVPSVGFFVKRNIPEVNANMYLHYKGSLSAFSMQTNNSYYETSNYLQHEYKITYSQISYNSILALSYEFSRKKMFRPNIHFGGFLNFAFTDSYSCKYESWLVVEEPPRLYSAGIIDQKPFFSIDYGPVLGIGFVKDISEKNAILVDLAYQKGFGLSTYHKTNFISLNIGFQF